MKDTTAEIKSWWREYVERAQDGEGNAYHGLHVQNFNPPCQIEVFWISEPLEGQLVFATHDRERPDKEVIVNGPYDGNEFLEEVTAVGQEDRWQQPVPPQSFKSPPGKKPKRVDILASTVATFIDRLQESIFTDFSSFNFLRGSRLWGNSSYHILIGNVTDYSVLGESKNAENSSATDEDDLAESDSAEESDTDTNEEREDDEVEPAGGGYIYPAVWVDAAPERTFEEKVWGSPRRENEVVYRDEILGNVFLAFRDGLLAVLDDDADRTLKLLNTFFGIGIIGRYFQWRSLQPREFISGRANQSGFKGSHAELSTPSGRNQLWLGESGPDDYERGLIQSEYIDYLLDITEVVFNVDDLRERITLHLQAHTHFLDDEYTASFLLNWNVIEQHVEDLLNRNLRDEFGVNRERRDTIQGRHWFISHRLELAEITNTIDDNVYSELDRHRTKRNRVVHEMDTVAVERAEDIDHLVSELLSRQINKRLYQTNIDHFQHYPVPMKPSTRQDARKGDYDPRKW